MQTATPAPTPTERRDDAPTLSEMAWEVADLAGGAAVASLPLLILAVPSAVLFLLLPALVLLAVAAVPVLVAAAVLGPAYLLTRSARSARARWASRRRGPRRSAPAARAGLGSATC
jgi:Flp pilus assembly protein TadB